ncbi:polymer-forming cytoskeletal protein [Sulfurimonas sp.]|uniref:bactofilin family protein n=1 Tax=Sulfurimonas sp. TaxID=2022749 RepID=UPI0035681891
MNLSCNLYVDGELEGKINSTKEVNIGKNGHINGDVTTQRLVVQGFVEGTLHADRVEIKANGHVKGTVEASELVIEAKGIFEGNSIVKGTKPAPKKIMNHEPSKEEIDKELKQA